jgi:hypothetical protein
LGVAPTKTWYVGDNIQGTLLKRKHNGWCLSINTQEDFELTKSLNSLLQILLPKSKTINHICQEYELETEISCTIYIVDETPVINLDQDIISKLAEFNIALDIDIILVE